MEAPGFSSSPDYIDVVDGTRLVVRIWPNDAKNNDPNDPFVQSFPEIIRKSKAVPGQKHRITELSDLDNKKLDDDRKTLAIRCIVEESDINQNEVQGGAEMDRNLLNKGEEPKDEA